MSSGGDWDGFSPVALLPRLPLYLRHPPRVLCLACGDLKLVAFRTPMPIIPFPDHF